MSLVLGNRNRVLDVSVTGIGRDGGAVIEWVISDAGDDRGSHRHLCSPPRLNDTHNVAASEAGGVT